jgi:hypothetical protein
MPLFGLRGEKPDMVHSDHCYVAETAVVIGKVRTPTGQVVSAAFALLRRGIFRDDPGEGATVDELEALSGRRRRHQGRELGLRERVDAPAGRGFAPE